MDKDTVYTKVTFGSSNQADGLQGRIWLTGTQKQIIAELGAKGFEVITKRPSRAAEKPVKVKKAKKAKKEAVAA
jgi:hypothetical protein